MWRRQQRFAEQGVEQRRALDHLAVAAADTSAQRGEVALARLRCREAAGHFANAAATLPADDSRRDQRIWYLWAEADALYRQSDEFGDNDPLLSVITRWSRLLDLEPRERSPNAWAAAQNNLGKVLGERESGTARLEEAAAIGARFHSSPASRSEDRPPPTPARGEGKPPRSPT